MLQIIRECVLVTRVIVEAQSFDLYVERVGNMLPIDSRIHTIEERMEHRSTQVLVGMRKRREFEVGKVSWRRGWEELLRHEMRGHVLGVISLCME